MRRPVPLPFDNAQGERLGSLYPLMVSQSNQSGHAATLRPSFSPNPPMDRDGRREDSGRG